jgi:hypothetical protein
VLTISTGCRHVIFECGRIERWVDRLVEYGKFGRGLKGILREEGRGLIFECIM